MVELQSYDGWSRAELVRRTGCTSVHIYHEVSSTMDVAHELAGNAAESGTLVLAESQLSGRGREGREWKSDADGIYLTLISRNQDLDAAQVLSLRVGLALRESLEAFCDDKLALKWPNDVLSASGKVAGILIETRWRGNSPEWTAVGIGINVAVTPLVQGAASLREDSTRVRVLSAVVPRVIEACALEGALSRAEVSGYMQVDLLRGRRVVAPLRGSVVGVSEEGELVVSTPDGIQTARSGSVRLEDDT